MRMLNGVPLPASAAMMSGMSWYRPSARWYGSVLVPSATGSLRHDGFASSFASTSPTFTFTMISESKSFPASSSR